jgi:outer membrane protein assembly factor BamD
MKLAIFMIVVFVLISCTTRQALPPLSAPDEFERAMAYFENKKYDSAIQAFERIIFYHPTSEYVDDAQYWLGRSYFENENYLQAAAEFDYLLRNFSNSIFSEEAYLYRAKSYFFNAPSYDRDQTGLMAALSSLNEFLTLYPNSEHTDEIRELILEGRNRLAKKEVENGKLYIKLKKPNAALLYFDYVLETYPETDVAHEARFYTAQVYEKTGKIDEALKRYRELLEDSDWKERAEKRIKEIEKESSTSDIGETQ